MPEWSNFLFYSHFTPLVNVGRAQLDLLLKTVEET